MLKIEYRIIYTGVVVGAASVDETGIEHEFVKVEARNVNSGYRKALKRALEPLGNGSVREIGSIEFWAAG